MATSQYRVVYGIGYKLLCTVREGTHGSAGARTTVLVKDKWTSRDASNTSENYCQYQYQYFCDNTFYCLLHSAMFIFTALHVMQTPYCDENSVCPSVCLSVCLSVCPSVTRVIPDKTVERSVQIFIPYERTFSLVFWEEEWLVGGDPFYVKFLVNRPPLERNRLFSTNNRS